MSLRKEQCNKVCRILDDVLANRPTERDALIVAVKAAFSGLERKTGKWIDEGFYADGHGAHAFRCSECGGHIIEYDADPFCKWCGADMRGENDDIPIEYFESGGK